MNTAPVIAAQLSSVHSGPEALHPDRVAGYLGEVAETVPIDILVLGWEDRPDLFTLLTSRRTRLSNEVFLWYPFLSDYPGLTPAHLVVNARNRTSSGWGGYDGTGIRETFKQACPNNPRAVSTSLMHMERLLRTYEFDGVFIDKIRFPSAANGLADVFTCFCAHCEEEASKSGLDLAGVKAALEDRGGPARRGSAQAIPPGARWLEELIADRPLLQRFIRFRADSVNRVLARIRALVEKMEKKIAMDVFSPGLAALVGQDSAFMAGHAEWVKPMIYRFGNGPSSLRSEIPALIRELGAYLGVGRDAVMDWVGSHVNGLRGVPLKEIERVAPLSLLRAETRKAVELFPHTPVYLGLETVFIPGVMEIRPEHVEEILEIGTDAGVQGYVLSWDLLHTPIENIVPIKKAMK